jgi:hypothetical protein
MQRKGITTHPSHLRTLAMVATLIGLFTLIFPTHAGAQEIYPETETEAQHRKLLRDYSPIEVVGVPWDDLQSNNQPVFRGLSTWVTLRIYF